MKKYGACIYCGQMGEVDTKNSMTEEELNEIVSRNCDCLEARTENEKSKNQEKAEENIEKLFGLHFPETEEILKAAVPSIMEFKISSITIDTGKGIKGKVSITSKGNIKVERTQNTKAVLEV